MQGRIATANFIIPAWQSGLSASTTRPRRSICAAGSRSPSTRSSPRCRACAASASPRRAEAAILSTCNRTEIYCARRAAPRSSTTRRLAGRQSAASRRRCCARTPTRCRTAQAARHAFRVASGLDSMVLGEPQILGQMKDAVRAADDRRRAGHHAATSCSSAPSRWPRKCAPPPRSARTRSAWPPRRCGWPAQLFEDLREIARAVRRRGRDDRAGGHALRRAGAQARSPIANRTLERGEKLASRFGGEAMRLADLPARLHEFDVVVSLHREHAADHRPGRGRARAQGAQAPADVHGRPGRAARHRARSRALDDVFLYTVDDLAHVVQTGQARRARPPWRRPRRSSTPACRASCTGWTSAAACR